MRPTHALLCDSSGADKAKEAMRKMRDFKPPQGGGAAGAILKVVGGFAALGVAGYYSLFSVEGGHRALKFNRLTGLGELVVEEGTHVRIPWLEWPVIFDVRTRPRNITSLTGSRDLQMVNVSVRVLSRPSPTDLPFIYRRLGQDYDERVLPSIVNEVCKQVIAQFNAAQLLTQREQVSALIQRNLVERAAEFKIVLDDVSLTDIRFGREFISAVEAKQVAQQDAERARFLVDKALQEKRSIIIKAEGEATSAALIGKAIANNPGFIELRRIDAARDVASTLSRSANRVFLGTESLMLDVMHSSVSMDDYKK